MSLSRLPVVTALKLLPKHAAQLTLDAGYTFMLTDEDTPHATLGVLESDGYALLITNYKDQDAPAFRVPAALYAELSPLFSLAR